MFSCLHLYTSSRKNNISFTTEGKIPFLPHFTSKKMRYFCQQPCLNHEVILSWTKKEMQKRTSVLITSNRNKSVVGITLFEPQKAISVLIKKRNLPSTPLSVTITLQTIKEQRKEIPWLYYVTRNKLSILSVFLVCLLKTLSLPRFHL